MNRNASRPSLRAQEKRKREATQSLRYFPQPGAKSKQQLREEAEKALSKRKPRKV